MSKVEVKVVDIKEAFKEKDKDAIIANQRALDIKEDDCIPLDLEELERLAKKYGIELG